MRRFFLLVIIVLGIACNLVYATDKPDATIDYLGTFVTEFASATEFPEDMAISTDTKQLYKAVGASGLNVYTIGKFDEPKKSLDFGIAGKALGSDQSETYLFYIGDSQTAILDKKSLAFHLASFAFGQTNFTLNGTIYSIKSDGVYSYDLGVITQINNDRICINKEHSAMLFKGKIYYLCAKDGYLQLASLEPNTNTASYTRLCASDEKNYVLCFSPQGNITSTSWGEDDYLCHIYSWDYQGKELAHQDFASNDSHWLSNTSGVYPIIDNAGECEFVYCTSSGRKANYADTINLFTGETARLTFQGTKTYPCRFNRPCIAIDFNGKLVIGLGGLFPMKGANENAFRLSSYNTADILPLYEDWNFAIETGIIDEEYIGSMEYGYMNGDYIVLSGANENLRTSRNYVFKFPQIKTEKEYSIRRVTSIRKLLY